VSGGYLMRMRMRGGGGGLLLLVDVAQRIHARRQVYIYSAVKHGL